MASGRKWNEIWKMARVQTSTTEQEGHFLKLGGCVLLELFLWEIVYLGDPDLILFE